MRQAGSAGRACWLGYYPKSGDPSKLWGAHLVGWTRHAARAWQEHLQVSAVRRGLGLDTWLRRFVQEKVLIQLAPRSLAGQRGHALKGRQ